MRLVALVAVLQLAGRATAAGLVSAAGEVKKASDSYTQLTFGSWMQSYVESDSWVDFYVVAEDSDASIVFEVAVDTGSPAAVAIFVNDDSDSAGTGISSATLHEAQGLRRSGYNAAALDSDWVSRVGNETTRHFYGYVSSCYAQAGHYYFLSVYGAIVSTAAFQVKATSTSAALTIGTVSGSVCDGKYANHFYDLASHMHSGGLQFHVAKTSGELQEWYVRYEHCAARNTGSLLHTGNLFGHGLTSGSVDLPNSDAYLAAGRYYVGVRGSTDLCGDYTITVSVLTSAQITEEAEEV